MLVSQPVLTYHNVTCSIAASGTVQVCAKKEYMCRSGNERTQG